MIRRAGIRTRSGAPGGGWRAPRARLRFLSATLLLALAVPAAAGVLYDFEQQFFVEDYGVKCKDHALVLSDSLYHLYYIQGHPGGPVPPLGQEQWLGHATSPDLRHWTRHDSILPVVPDSWENGFIWAPHVMENPEGGWIMFYTGADDSPEVRQRVGMAHSEDLFEWTRWEDNPAYEPGDWTDWDDPLFYADCRDPFVFQVPGDTLHYMLNTVREAGGQGAVDLAVSEDLHAWAHLDTFMRHSSQNMLESVALWQDEAGKWHVFFTEQNHAGTYHTQAYEPWGPFWPGAAKLFDPGYGAEVTVLDDRNLYSRYAKVALAAGDRYYIRFDDMKTPLWGGDWPVLENSQGFQDWWSPQFGTAFDNQPTWGDNPLERGEASSNMEGNSYVSTLELYPYPGFTNPGRTRGASPIGLLKSDPFVIEKDRMKMLVGGGDKPSACFVALVRDSDKRLLFRETGANSVAMDPRLWNLESLVGETVFLVVADLSTISWGWIATDSIEEYERAGDDPIPASDPLVEDLFLGDLIAASGVVWHCDFSASKTFGPAPHYVIFTNETDGEAEIYEWDFEADGIVDRFTRDAAHSYYAPGVYTVRLRVVNALGMEAVKEKENYIIVLEDETNVMAYPAEFGSGLPTPVSFAYSGGDSVGHFQASVDYDSTLIEFDSVQNWLSGYTFEAEREGQRIHVSWHDSTGVNPILPQSQPLFLFGLRFSAKAASDTTRLAFVDDLCLLRDATGDSIQPVGWVDEDPFGRVILDVDCLVTGQVEYFNDGEELFGAVLSMGPPGEDAVSNSYGEYEFEPYPMGDYVLRASKQDNLGGINALDAGKVMRHHFGFEALEGSQRLRAGDVNLDAAVDSLDAWAIARRAAGLEALLSGDWVFEPDSVAFEPLYMDVVADFVGMRMGDVDGSWAGEALRGDGADPPRDGIVLSLPDSIVGFQQPIPVPLTASGLQDISALSLRITYLDSLLNFLGAVDLQPGLENLLVGDDGDGLLSLEWFDTEGGQQPFSQDGDTLMVLQFTLGREQWTIAPLEFRPESALGDSLCERGRPRAGGPARLRPRRASCAAAGRGGAHGRRPLLGGVERPRRVRAPRAQRHLLLSPRGGGLQRQPEDAASEIGVGEGRNPPLVPTENVARGGFHPSPIPFQQTDGGFFTRVRCASRWIHRAPVLSLPIGAGGITAVASNCSDADWVAWGLDDSTLEPHLSSR